MLEGKVDPTLFYAFRDNDVEHYGKRSESGRYGIKEVSRSVSWIGLKLWIYENDEETERIFWG